jgi:putative flippase GtrA
MARSGESGRRRISQVSSIGELYARFRQLIHEGAKFLVIGAIGAIVTFGVANALHPIGKYKAITVATILATVITYLGNRYWTFRHRQGKGTTRDSTMFFVMNGIGLLIYYACIGIVDLAGLGHNLAWYNVALVVGTGLGTMFRFWSYRRWIWLAHPEAPAAVEELTPEMAAVVGAETLYTGSTDGGSVNGASVNRASVNGASANGASANGSGSANSASAVNSASATGAPRSHAKPGRPSFRHAGPADQQSADGRSAVSHRRS